MIYISIILFCICAAKAYKQNSLLEPITIYSLWISIYPIITLFYYKTLENPLWYVIPDFSKNEIEKYTQISAAATLGLIAANFNQKKEKNITIKRIMNTSYLIKIAVIIITISYIYIYTNKEIFLNNYIYQEIRASNWDPKIANAINTLTALEIFFICCLQFFMATNSYEVTQRKHKAWIYLLTIVYLIFKLIIGSRILFVVLALSLLYWTKKQTLKIKRSKFLALSLFAILLFIAFNGIRNSENSFIESSADLSKEFIFASVSALYSVEYAATPESPNLITITSDSLISLIPSALLPDGTSKTSLLNYEKWKEYIGGYRNISPIGGYFLPGQIFLVTNSLIAVFLFFYIYGKLLIHSLKIYRTSKSIFSALLTIQIITFGVIFGIRTELWVLLKMYLQQFIAFSLLFLLILKAKINK